MEYVRSAIDSDARCADVLRRYPKAVAHLWRQNHERRLSLMYGAGASMDLGFPPWSTLIERIAGSDEVLGQGIIGTSNSDPLPMAAQVLFHHFRAQVFDKLVAETGSRELAERMAIKQWRDIVHAALYRDVPDEDEEFATRDTAYGEFLDVILSSPLTVNYNFDDAIERLIGRRTRLRARAGDRGDGRGYESVVDPRLVLRRAEGNILHINGFLPQNQLEAVEGPLVLNEISFEDQLIDSIAGAYSTLLHFLTKHTFLLIGLSLADETLRHLLRQNSILNPGHFHYRVHHVSRPEDVTGGDALARSHFETFNLVTLYLTSDEIGALGKLISAKSTELTALARRSGVRTSFTYYLAGVPGAGKTTSFKHFSSLVALDEWFEERLEPMSKPFPELDEQERREIDDWVLTQIRLKNQALSDQGKSPGIGLYIVDRCPPDAIGFTDPELWADKAASVRDAIGNGEERAPIVPGTVLLLLGDPEELLYRAKARNRQTSATNAQMTWQQDALRRIYSGVDDRVSGTVEIATRGMSVRAVVQHIARIVHLDSYVEADLQARVVGFAEGTLSPPCSDPPRS